MEELVVISGKGGTGKTSIAAAFASLAENTIIADCDVDAADLYLVLKPQNLKTYDFFGGVKATVLSEQCTGCRKCVDLCRFDAIKMIKNEKSLQVAKVDSIACEGCGVCAWFCQEKVITVAPVQNGEWFVSQTRYGMMVHAKLGVAQENSGKLVTLIRKEAQKISEEKKLARIIIDGSPGIGCPVIASITGAQKVLIVAEPSQSSLHDLKRVATLARYFKCKIYICVNKWDINHHVSSAIKDYCLRHNYEWAGTVRYDEKMNEAQIQQKTITELMPSGISRDIEKIWHCILKNDQKEATHELK